MANTLGLSVVVPVYNSEGTLPQLVNEFRSVLESLGKNYELILVDDDSKDRSWDVICKLQAENDWIRSIALIRNYGQHNALLSGIRMANYEITVTVDDDLQYPPREIPKLLDKLNEGYDVVYGTPAKRRHNFWRNLASWITKLVLQKVIGADIARKVGPFRVFRTQVRDAFERYNSPHVSIDVLLTWGTRRFAAVSVDHQLRKVGRSNYTFRKLIVHTLNLVTGFSSLPLKIATIIGFASTVFGILVLIFVLRWYWYSGGSVPGFAFTASIIAIFGGAQLLALGVIGEYIARIHFSTMDRPAYTIRQTADSIKNK